MRDAKEQLTQISYRGMGSDVGNLLDVIDQWFGNEKELAKQGVVGAENVLVLPKRELLWKRERGKEYETESYRQMTCMMVSQAINGLCPTSNSVNHSTRGYNLIGEKEQLKVVSETTSALIELERMYSGDFIAFPFQFGIKHRGCTTAKMLSRLDLNEFPLPTYAVAMALQSFPERFSLNVAGGGDVDEILKTTLVCGCAGDKFSSAKGDNQKTLVFEAGSFAGERGLQVTLKAVDDTVESEDLYRYGSVTGFVPRV